MEKQICNTSHRYGINVKKLFFKTPYKSVRERDDGRGGERMSIHTGSEQEMHNRETLLSETLLHVCMRRMT